MNLKSRITKLEAHVQARDGAARVITIKGGDLAQDDDVDAFLRSKGIHATPSDQVVHFKTFFERKDGSVETEGPLELVNVVAMPFRQSRG